LFNTEFNHSVVRIPLLKAITTNICICRIWDTNHSKQCNQGGFHNMRIAIIILALVGQSVLRQAQAHSHGARLIAAPRRRRPAIS
jgi:hypothetical protein